MLFLYVPVAQAEHCVPGGPVYPLLHTHALMAVCANNECAEFNGQMVHGVVAYQVARNPSFTTERSDVNFTYI
ncbi:MAG: hypothetical protein EBR09_12055 [Proteobacteria bacterium]|nr:hypothetical protein [Gammaproteobacteria bacterium]NBX18087.1 hypothetical protein [Pseudomonadota bacterium]